MPALKMETIYLAVRLSRHWPATDMSVGLGATAIGAASDGDGTLATVPLQL